jgi:hypothetical protein
MSTRLPGRSLESEEVGSSLEIEGIEEIILKIEEISFEIEEI